MKADSRPKAAELASSAESVALTAQGAAQNSKGSSNSLIAPAGREHRQRTAPTFGERIQRFIGEGPRIDVRERWITTETHSLFFWEFD